jgi:hypothetical protein
METESEISDNEENNEVFEDCVEYTDEELASMESSGDEEESDESKNDENNDETSDEKIENDNADNEKDTNNNDDDDILEEIPVMLGDSLIEGEINVENVNDEQ